MNSLIFLGCVVGAMVAGFMLGSFYERDLARIDVNYWKSMCELNTKHWQRMYDLERGHRKATDVTPEKPDESVSDDQERGPMMSEQPLFDQLWAQYRMEPKVPFGEFDDFLIRQIKRLRKTNTELISVCKDARKRLSEVGLSADRCEQPIADIEVLVRQIDDALAEHRGTTSPSPEGPPS